MRFEWDEEKAEANRKKHGVSFEEALAVFDDPYAVELIDEAHSTEDEIRYAIIGLASPGLLLVVFTEKPGGVIRIIHARRAEKKFVRLYEDEKKRY